MKDRAGPTVPLNPLHWFPEFWQLGRQRLRPQVRLLGLSLSVGVIAGLGAVIFYAACQLVFHYALDVAVGYQPGGPANEPSLFRDSGEPFRWWLLLIVPALGGLASGFLVYTLAPEAEGHGTDSAIAAYHFKGGLIRPRVPLVKILASAITLGTGGSGGREGPIAQIGAGFGSWLGGLLRLRPAERRLLMAAGMGAGIAAIFRAPLAGALFAAEVLYRSPDFESEVVIPAALACITAYSTFNRQVPGSCFTITVMENVLTKEKKFLPACFVVNTWDAKTDALTSSETHYQTWQRIGAFDLPKSTLAVKATAGKLESRGIKLSIVHLK